MVFFCLLLGNPRYHDMHCRNQPRTRKSDEFFIAVTRLLYKRSVVINHHLCGSDCFGLKPWHVLITEVDSQTHSIVDTVAQAVDRHVVTPICEKQLF